MTVAQMRGLADIAQAYGDGDIRLTVWQNLILSGVPEARAGRGKPRSAIGLASRASHVRAGLVACTGNTGCKFAASNTKGTALAIAERVEASGLALDAPVNIHLTGCHHSCAQHYIGDIGLIATRVAVAPDSEDTVEGFHVHVGGGFGPEAAHRARTRPRRARRGLPGAGGAPARRLPRAPRRPGRELPRLHAPHEIEAKRHDRSQPRREAA